MVLDSELPHLIGIDDDILSTGIMLFHIKEGTTSIGTKFSDFKQDIVLQGISIFCCLLLLVCILMLDSYFYILRVIVDS